MTDLMNPDCTAGKHDVCDGGGWNLETDMTVQCPCQCHPVNHTARVKTCTYRPGTDVAYTCGANAELELTIRAGITEDLCSLHLAPAMLLQEAPQGYVRVIYQRPTRTGDPT